jgi:ribosomal protein L2
MGKRIIQQRRGAGSLTYRVRKKASLVRPGYPATLEGEYTVVKLVHSRGHSVPIAKLTNKSGDVFYNFAANLLFVGQKIVFGGKSAAGDGRTDKPILKAGKKFYIMKSKSKLWPRTSAVAMNKIDHPFGSGRGKRVKSKIAKRNASPGKKVGHLRPRRTGRKKR